MPRWPFLTAVLFVGTSMLTAFLYHHWQLSRLEARIEGEASFASQESLIEQIEDILSKSQDAQRRISEMGLAGAHDAYRCQCSVAGIDSPYFQFENPDECGPTRNYFGADLEKFPPIFRDTRSRPAADFPRICFTYIMKRQFAKADHEAKGYLAQCQQRDGTPVRGNLKPCVTETYVNVIYNLFSDVTSCFGSPQKDFLPKIFNESGFHLNALGAGFDSGVGQLTGPALEHANLAFENYRRKVKNSDSESCRRISPYMDKLKPIPVSKEIGISNRCRLIMPPDNPLLNLFYMAIKYEQDVYAVNYYLKKFDIPGMMKNAGIARYEVEQLQQILIALSFNAGASSAVIYLKNFLEMRADLIKKGKARKLTLADFNFNEDTESFKGLKPEQVDNSSLSFPQYLMIYQASGAKGYLSSVATYARLLNTTFKEGTCVADSYLSLSL